jgi:hypothetical protein
MIRVVIVFFVFYFWLSALVYAEQVKPCDVDSQIGLNMDSDTVNPGCDKDYLEEMTNREGQEI